MGIFKCFYCHKKKRKNNRWGCYYSDCPEYKNCKYNLGIYNESSHFPISYLLFGEHAMVGSTFAISFIVLFLSCFLIQMILR